MKKKYTGQDVAKLLEVEENFLKVLNESEIRDSHIEKELETARNEFFSSEPVILDPKDFNLNEFEQK